MEWGIVERKNKNPGRVEEETLTPVSPFPLYFYSIVLVRDYHFASKCLINPKTASLANVLFHYFHGHQSSGNSDLYSLCYILSSLRCKSVLL